jgi:tRNA isopentenyl-2-thiomethyl-A-37 hydroxylase MiaE
MREIPKGYPTLRKIAFYATLCVLNKQQGNKTMGRNKKPETMRQCAIERKEEKAVHSQIAWLPSEVSVVGKMVTLKAEDHKHVWEVKEAYQKEVPYKDVKKMSDSHRDHRKATDI